MDAQMLLGCSGFLIASISGYAIAVWPFFFWQEIETPWALGRNSALGFVPHLVLVALVVRRYGLAGLCGAVGGGAAVAVFIYLRLQAAFVGAAADTSRKVEYSSAWVVAVPAVWLGLVALLGIFALPSDERPSGNLGASADD